MDIQFFVPRVHVCFAQTVDDGTITWLLRVNDEEIISLSHAMVCILRFCVTSRKGESEPNIKYCLGRTLGLVQRFITIQNFGHNRRSEYFPGSLHWSFSIKSNVLLIPHLCLYSDHSSDLVQRQSGVPHEIESLNR